MTQEAGIYGFAITKAIDVQGARIEPVSMDGRQVKVLARDQLNFHLTAVVKAERLDASFLFNLEAVLAFIERLDVLIANPVSAEDRTNVGHQQTISSHRRNSGGGAVLPEDTWAWGESRGEFVRLAMTKLGDSSFCERTTFNTFLFKYVESFRQRKPFIEVSWFFLYSGLEAFARAVTGDQSKNSSEPITALLKSFGFNVYQDNPSDFWRSISTYMHLRNALFNNGQHEAQVNVNGSMVTLRMTDYLFNFQQLVALTILKAAGFESRHINWDSWIDRQAFK